MKRILIFVFLLIFSFSIVNATLTDNIVSYYTFDDTNLSGSNPLDLTGNFTATNTGATTGVTGKINEAFQFGSGDTLTTDTGNIYSNGLTVSLWLNLDDTTTTVVLDKWLGSGNNRDFILQNIGSNYYFYISTDGTNSASAISTTNFSTNTWYHVVGTYDNNDIKIYVNGVLEDTESSLSGSIHAGTELITMTGNGENDEFGIWQRALTQTEITTLYNNGNGLQYPFPQADPVLSFINITANGNVLTNNTFYNDSILFETNVLNTSTNGNVNHSYSINGANYVPFATNTLNGRLLIEQFETDPQVLINGTEYPLEVNLLSQQRYCIEKGGVFSTTGTNFTVGSFSVAGWFNDEWQVFTGSKTSYINCTTAPKNYLEGSYNITFKAENNETNVTSNTYDYIIDTTEPTIEVLQNISEESYELNFSTIFNVTDNLSGLASCFINITELSNVSNPDNFYINCTDTQTFTSAGFHNLSLVATDNAGNVNTFNDTFLINPLINIFFNQSNGSIVLNYTATIFHPDGRETIPEVQPDGSIQLSPVNNGDLDLGLHTIQFSKLGFATENFTQIVNETNAGINVTFNVSDSVIVIKIFDRDTQQLLTGLTTITLLATNGFNGSTTTGKLNVSDINFISEQYQILAEHAGYNSESVYFNYNNQEILNVNIYMLNSTQVGQIKIIVKNSLSQFVESAVCSVLEWRPATSSFVSVAQGLTNVNGEVLLNIELNTKIYKFSCTKQEFTTTSDSQIIQIDNSQLTIILDDVVTIPDTLFPNLVTNMTNSTLNETHQLITYNFADSDGLTTEGCIKYYYLNGNRRTFGGEQCVASSTGEILLTLNINTTNGVLVQGVLTTPSVIDYVTDQIKFKGNGDIAASLAQIGLDVLIPTILVLMGIALGISMSKVEIAAIFVAIAGWTSVAFVPTILSSTIAMFISVIVGLMLWGGYKAR